MKVATLEKFHLRGGIKILGTQGWEKLGGEGFFFLQAGGGTDPGWHYDYFKYILKKHGENIDNSSVKIYVNKIENTIAFKIKTRYYLELLTPETRLFGSTENEMAKNENGENVTHLEITEVVLVHCNIVTNGYQ